MKTSSLITSLIFKIITLIVVTILFTSVQPVFEKGVLALLVFIFLGINDFARISLNYFYNNNDPENTSEYDIDDDYQEAKDYILSENKASVSSLQTNFRWGYNKATRILSDLQKMGLISSELPRGQRYYEVLISSNEVTSVISDYEQKMNKLKSEAIARVRIKQRNLEINRYTSISFSVLMYLVTLIGVLGWF